MKFRVWDRKLLLFDRTGDFFIDEEGKLRRWDGVLSAFQLEDANRYTYKRQPRYITQLGTGILDSKGIEIFEGDVIAFKPLYRGDDKFKGAVYYRPEEGAFYHTFEAGRPSKRFWGIGSSYSYTIIGHINEVA